MRLRHKKNLETRLEAANDYLITLRTESRNFNDAKNEKNIIDLEEIFGNSNPVYLEIGGGKGQFACTFAEQNPDVNMLCIEKISDVIVLACEKATPGRKESFSAKKRRAREKRIYRPLQTARISCKKHPPERVLFVYAGGAARRYLAPQTAWFSLKKSSSRQS